MREELKKWVCNKPCGPCYMQAPIEPGFCPMDGEDDCKWQEDETDAP